MEMLGKLLDTVSSVTNLFTNPYQVRDVPLSDYDGQDKVKLREEGWMVLYKNTHSQSWDCVLTSPETPASALRSVSLSYGHRRAQPIRFPYWVVFFYFYLPYRLFQVTSEEDAMNWFPHYALKLQPFYETLPLRVENTQVIVDCIRNHPDWSSAHIAIDTGLMECLKHNYVQR